MEIEVTQADREVAASGYFAWCSGNPVIPDRMKAGNADDHSMVQAFARHRQAAFADGFTAALQGAEAAIWRIEDDAFLYENVSKALQEVISELQAMEQNWTGRVTIEHRQAAIKQRDAEIVAWLRDRKEMTDRYIDYVETAQAADCIEAGEV